MKRLVFGLVCAIVWFQSGTSPLYATQTTPLVVVGGPTVIAFFPPVTDALLSKDQDTNEALADFQLYAAQSRVPLKRAGVKLVVVYAHSFHVRLGKTETTFRTGKDEVGYYLITPGKKARVERGVTSDEGLIQVAKEYFGLPIK